MDLVVAKTKEGNAHKKAAKRAELRANAKLVTIKLSAKKADRLASVQVYRVTVETESLIVARYEARKAVRGLGFSDHELIELDCTKNH